MSRLVFFVTLVVVMACVMARKGKIRKTKDCQSRRCSNHTSQPVCGSDGVSYSSKCEFRIAKCLASRDGKKLLIHHEGKCGAPNKIKTENANNNNNNNKKRGKKRRRKCPANFSRCKTLNSTRNSVCGSDNTTYRTFCHFKIVKCRSQNAGKPLTLLYRGVCGKPKVRMVCPIESQCPNRQSPICGGDGKTYRNLCFFLIAKCEARKRKIKLRLQYRGSCGNPVTPKPCPTSCPKIYKPVCGTDGNTYKNGCEMALKKCRLPKGQKRHLRLKHRGTCDNPSTPKPCLTMKKCRRKRGMPVCGTDGVTYESKCHLRVIKCLAKRSKRSPIALKHMGKCK